AVLGALEKAREVLVELQAAPAEIRGRGHLALTPAPLRAEPGEHASRGAREALRGGAVAIEVAAGDVLQRDDTGFAEPAPVSDDHRAQPHARRRQLGLRDHRALAGLAILAVAVVVQDLGSDELCLG